MHKELIGQEASLSLPCTVDSTALLLGFIEELMEVSGAETSEPERLEQDLRQAIDAICRDDEDAAACHVVATLEIHDSGVDVRLNCERQGTADNGLAEPVVAAREA